MRVAKSRVVNLFIKLGCLKAPQWNDTVLAGRVALINQLFSPDMLVGEYQQLLTQVCEASRLGLPIDIVADTDEPVEEILSPISKDARMLPEGIEPPDIDYRNVEEEEPSVTEQGGNTAAIDSHSEENSREQNPSEPEVVNVPQVKKRRRPHFTFEALGIPVGSRLQSVRDNAYEVTVVSNKAVQIGTENASVVSLTKATMIVNSLKHAVQPTGFWLYGGKTLREIYDAMYPVKCE